MNSAQWVKASLILRGHLYEIAKKLTNSNPYFFLLESFKNFPLIFLPPFSLIYHTLPQPSF